MSGGHAQKSGGIFGFSGEFSSHFGGGLAGSAHTVPTNVAFPPRYNPLFEMNKIWYECPEQDPFYQALAATVIARRKSLGLTQEQVAAAGDISRAELQFVEGARRRVTMQTLRGLSLGLHYPWVADLLLDVERRLHVPGHGAPTRVA